MNEEINYKDLTKNELDNLKDIYVVSRINSMSEHDLRLFVKEVLEVQIKGTVGNEEEKEAWDEMKNHFDLDFLLKVKEVKKNKGGQEDAISPEEKEFLRRIELLEKQKESQGSSNNDMWGDE